MGSKIENYVPKQAVQPEWTAFKGNVKAQPYNGSWSNRAAAVPTHLGSQKSTAQRVLDSLSQGLRYVTDVKDPRDVFFPLKILRQADQMATFISGATANHVAKLMLSNGDAGPQANRINGTHSEENIQRPAKGQSSEDKLKMGMVASAVAFAISRNPMFLRPMFAGGTYGGVATLATDIGNGKFNSFEKVVNTVDPSDYVLNIGTSALMAQSLSAVGKPIGTSLQKLVGKTGWKMTDGMALVAARSGLWFAENAIVQNWAKGEVDWLQAAGTGFGGGVMTYAPEFGKFLGLPIDQRPILIALPVTLIAGGTKIFESFTRSVFLHGAKNQSIDGGPSGTRESDAAGSDKPDTPVENILTPEKMKAIIHSSVM